MKNTYTMNKQIIILFFVLLNSFTIFAQDDKIKFGAYARALQQNNKLGEEDTLNIDNTSGGHVLVDLGVNINPDKKTEIVAIVRLRSDLGGFFGSGTSALLRQAYVKGIVGKFLNYQVGDMYLKLSPYTFYNNYAEGSANEGRVFSDLRRDYTYYENLNRGNYWWQQGAYTNFALAFQETFIDSIRFDAFFLRNRVSTFDLAGRYHGGGRMTITQSEKLKMAVNYVNLFEVGATIGSDTALRNPVTSFELDYRILNQDNMALGIFGEAGYSNFVYTKDTAKAKNDIFYEAGAKFDLKPANLSFKASYMYVGPEFFSSAAQSKRVNFSKDPALFPIYGNDPFNPVTRNITTFDLVRDPSLYNAGITPYLMTFNPIYANAQPYGKATPNRSGINFNVVYKDSAQKIVVDAYSSLLSEPSGEGSAEKRKFLIAGGGVNFNIHKFIGFEKKIIVSAGDKFEKTTRGGTSLESIDLTSNLLDLGLEIEVLKKLDLLLGAKILTAKGNEFISVRDKYNNISVPVPTGTMDVSQTLYGVGLKYRFSANTYLTVQDHYFMNEQSTPAIPSYSINQIWILFNMNF
ncbi:MAG: hypothetical protein K2X86_04875 [Cytophagaceae bacterium]|nr:hypothetical protein [Cytophagaceae bacterium]